MYFTLRQPRGVSLLFAVPTLSLSHTSLQKAEYIAKATLRASGKVRIGTQSWVYTRNPTHPLGPSSHRLRPRRTLAGDSHVRQCRTLHSEPWGRVSRPNRKSRSQKLFCFGAKKKKKKRKFRDLLLLKLCTALPRASYDPVKSKAWVQILALPCAGCVVPANCLHSPLRTSLSLR